MVYVRFNHPDGVWFQFLNTRPPPTRRSFHAAAPAQLRAIPVPQKSAMRPADTPKRGKMFGLCKLCAYAPTRSTLYHFLRNIGHIGT